MKNYKTGLLDMNVLKVQVLKENIPHYKTLLHYGKIIADYENTKENTRITVFLYYDKKYTVVKQNGIVQIINQEK